MELRKSNGQFKPKFIPKAVHKKVYNLRFIPFRPKLKFNIPYKNFTIKTAENSKELIEALKLRHEVFFQEKLGAAEAGLDFEALDMSCDHVILIDNNSLKVFGTYRIRCSQFTNDFYSSGEFHIDEFLRSSDEKMELGRACIHKDFRTGTAISLIWKGIAQYATMTDSKYMFGCASIDTTLPELANLVFENLKRDHFSEDYQISPKAQYALAPLAREMPEATVDVFDIFIPSLLKSYLKAGAKIYGRPAIDKEMQTTDFLTILDLQQISEKYKKRYF